MEVASAKDSQRCGVAKQPLMAASAPLSTSSPGLLHRLRFIPRLLDQSHLRRGRYHLISTQTYLKYAVMNSPRSFKSNTCDLCVFLP